MTNLQQCVTHSGDCSCYQVIIDKNGISHDCDICDCGALRKEIRNVNVSDEVINCWTKHLLAISRNKNI